VIEAVLSVVSCTPPSPAADMSLRCEYCEYCTDHKGELELHARVHSGEKTFVCRLDGCDFSTNQQSDRMRHESLSHPDRFKCDVCDYETVHKDYLTRHLLGHTSTEKLFECTECSFRAHLQSDLTKHLRGHKIVANRPFQCAHCDRACRDKADMVKHLLVHSGEKAFSCDYCEYRASVKGNLIRHMRKHTGEKPYACEYCEYRAGDKSCLTKHLRKHTGEKPYACELCDSRFVDKRALRSHMNEHAPLHVCGHCGERFKLEIDLTEHARVHVVEKPIQCAQCAFRTDTTPALIAHHMEMHS
jgi:KRAB domain-containing zinc finger protein